MDFVSQEGNVKLIKQIKLRPCLYNKNLSSYNRKSAQERAWDEIAKYMGWQAAQCKERWRNLRCVYIRHIKKMSQGVQIRPYYLMKLMSFALPFVRPVNCEQLSKEILDVLQKDDDCDEKESVTNNDEEQSDTRKSTENQPFQHRMESESPEPSQPFATEFIPTTNTTVEIKHEDDSLSSDFTQSRNVSHSRERSLMMKSNEFEVEMPDPTTNIDLNKDARKMFLYSLLPDVYAMSDAQMRQFKLNVLKFIGDIFDSEN